MTQSKSVNLVPTGQTGLKFAGQYLREEWHRKLTGKRFMRVAREMRDNSATISTSINLAALMGSGARWWAEPADDSDEALREAEWLDGAFDELETGWRKIVRSAIDNGLTFGYCPHEKVHKLRRGRTGDPVTDSRFSDNRWGLRDLEFRAPESGDGWERKGRTDKVVGWYQLVPNGGSRVLIPSSKLWNVRPFAPKNSPEGRPLTRHCYRAYYMQKNLEDIQAIGFQRNFAMMPSARLPADYFGEDATPAKKAVFDDVANTLRHWAVNEQAAIIFPGKTDPVTGNDTGFDIGLIGGNVAKGADMDSTIDRYKKDEAMVFVSQFLFLGMTQVGSNALSSDMTLMHAQTIGSILDEIEESVNREVVQPLYDLNRVPEEYRARWKHGDIEKEDSERFARTLMALAGSGALTSDSTLEDFVRSKLDLPERQDDFSADPFAE